MTNKGKQEIPKESGKQNTGLTFTEMLETIETLSNSQGFYGRLLADINALDDEQRGEIAQLWESKKFKDTIDFIMWLEG